MNHADAFTILAELSFGLAAATSVYFFGRLWLLTWAALVFVLLIFIRPRSDA